MLRFLKTGLKRNDKRASNMGLGNGKEPSFRNMSKFDRGQFRGNVSQPKVK